MKQIKILVVDDNKDYCSLITKMLEKNGATVICNYDAIMLSKSIKDFDPSVILLDVMLPDRSGIEVIPSIKKVTNCPVVMISNREDSKLIVAAMKAGATDYIPKTASSEELWEKIKKLNEIQLTKDAEGKIKIETPIIGESLLAKNLLKMLVQIAQSDAPVFLRGESGTGKSLIAQTLHSISPRKDSPFVTINCPAIPSALLESELFGHEKGSFTGAIKTKEGKFEAANNGTIFMDEIGDLSIDLQVKVLRVIQNKEFERVGGLKTIKTNTRIIAATNSNIEKAVQEGRFREDLYYRLNVLPIYVPALRERKEDIPKLVEYFLKAASEKEGKSFEPLSQDVMGLLTEYTWPGNIRELENSIERAVILGKEPVLRTSDFSMQRNIPLQQLQQPVVTPSQTPMSLKDIEYKNLVEALNKTSGNVSKTAKMLGLSRDTLYRKMKKYGIGLKN